jgi:hypothetical protein
MVLGGEMGGIRLPENFNHNVSIMAESVRNVCEIAHMSRALQGARLIAHPPVS